MNEKFAKWWEADGQFIDPDSSDVPWFDKRQELAEDAFLAGLEAERERVKPLIDFWRDEIKRCDWQKNKAVKKTSLKLCPSCNFTQMLLDDYTTPQNDGQRDSHKNCVCERCSGFSSEKFYKDEGAEKGTGGEVTIDEAKSILEEGKTHVSYDPDFWTSHERAKAFLEGWNEAIEQSAEIIKKDGCHDPIGKCVCTCANAIRDVLKLKDMEPGEGNP